MVDGTKVVGENVADSIPGGQLLEGRYRLVRRLATGGMASVYVAEHTRIGRPVAVKVMHEQYADDAECVRRFLDEGRTVGNLGHPHIIESTDMGYTASGAPFLVLELLEGRTLEDEIRRKGPLPVLRAARIAQQIASALAAAHDKGIIHRDLKSGNVFLVNRTDGDHVKVLDFGISKFLEGRNHTQKGKVLGTPWFMSPEQINDPGSVDARCDVYSLGVILYEMLTGKVPFDDEPFPFVFTNILYDEPPPVETLRPDVGAQLSAVVASALVKAPAQRMQSMEEFGRALATIAGPYRPEMCARGRAHSEFELEDELPGAGTTPVVSNSESSRRPGAPPTIGPPPVLGPPPAVNDAARPARPRARLHSRLENIPPPPRRRAIAGIAALVAAAAVAAIFFLAGRFRARERNESPPATSLEARLPVERPSMTPSSPRSEATGATGQEGTSRQPSGEQPLAGTPPAPPADMVHLTIGASTRGARATFRGQTYRLPMRRKLARGNGPEPIEIGAPGHVSRAFSITLDQDRRLIVVDLPRVRRRSDMSRRERSGRGDTAGHGEASGARRPAGTE